MREYCCWARQSAKLNGESGTLTVSAVRFVAQARCLCANSLGTLDEATEILELRKHGLHDKSVVLLNTAGFYDGLALQLARTVPTGSCPCPWTSWSSSPTTVPAHWPTSRNPSECGDRAMAAWLLNVCSQDPPVGVVSFSTPVASE